MTTLPISDLLTEFEVLALQALDLGTQRDHVLAEILDQGDQLRDGVTRATDLNQLAAHDPHALSEKRERWKWLVSIHRRVGGWSELVRRPFTTPLGRSSPPAAKAIGTTQRLPASASRLGDLRCRITTSEPITALHVSRTTVGSCSASHGTVSSNGISRRQERRPRSSRPRPGERTERFSRYPRTAPESSSRSSYGVKRLNSRLSLRDLAVERETVIYTGPLRLQPQHAVFTSDGRMLAVNMSSNFNRSSNCILLVDAETGLERRRLGADSVHSNSPRLFPGRADPRGPQYGQSQAIQISTKMSNSHILLILCDYASGTSVPGNRSDASACLSTIRTWGERSTTAFNSIGPRTTDGPHRPDEWRDPNPRC